MRKSERLHMSIRKKTLVLPSKIISKNYSMVSTLLLMSFCVSGLPLLLGRVGFGKAVLGILAGKLFFVTFLITCACAGVLFLVVHYNYPKLSEKSISYLLFSYVNIAICIFFLVFRQTYMAANDSDKARILIVFILYIYLAAPLLQLADFWKRMFPMLYGCIFTVVGIVYFNLVPNVAAMLLLAALAGVGIANSIAGSKNSIIMATKSKLELKEKLEIANSSISSLNSLKDEISKRLSALELEEIRNMVKELESYGSIGRKFDIYQKHAFESMEKIVAFQNSIESKD